MINTEHTSIKNIIIHEVGNKLLEEELLLSGQEVTLEDENLLGLLQTYFFQSFKSEALFHLKYENEPSENKIFHFATEIFEQSNNFIQTSQNIAQYLFDLGNHQKIKKGFFYVIFFEEVILADELTEAVGLFKAESIENFLQIVPSVDNVDFSYQQGFPLQKLDKGALIFNTEKDKGYKVAMFDRTGKGETADYWKEDFLSLASREDSYYHTQNYMKLCKDFVQDVFNEENQVEKAEQIELLNKSVTYFQEKDSFNVEEFEQEVIEHPEVVEAFREYKQNYQEDYEIKAFDEFDISQNAVKNTKRQMKSVLKLDKNFSVYIHGNKRDFIQKGYDSENDLHYYQLFFKEEK